ncbi:uncharacterized protein LOC126882497 [Diabrotica virgifera virgifera]|uniref:Tc1-like transposase DDE domain-containing protein n=1 Tax=Diabrotica virgifera virgifera TaxID=50390 RepID=A0ABM5JZQ5_DIAVI|nr:uncharacterized protein LOC126882497 [Diabrotica virgifera virgifera]
MNGSTTSVSSHRDAFVRGLTTGLKPPTARGPRFVLLHAGGKDGFINGAELTFLAKKNTADYHDEMDGPLFENWFKTKLLPNIPDKTVIVMDNAAYHSRKFKRIPNNSNNKEEIKEWLRSKDIYFEEDYLKSELLDVVAHFKSQYDERIVDKIAKSKNVKLLRLPPYHCELNPIELVWSEIKRFLARHNTNFKKLEVENLNMKHTLNYVQHVISVERRMWNIDNLLDNIDPVIINLNDDSGSESEKDGSIEEI